MITLFLIIVGFPVVYILLAGLPRSQVNEQEPTAKGLTSQYQGKTYYFCSPSCKRQFEQYPQRYVGQQSAER